MHKQRRYAYFLNYETHFFNEISGKGTLSAQEVAAEAVKKLWQ